MTRPEQKALEKQSLETFLELCPDAPAGTRVYGREGPDLRVGDARRIGIEHTGFAWSTRSREGEGWGHGVVARAQGLWRAAGLPPVQVNVGFRAGRRAGMRAEAAAGVLVDLVRTQVPEVVNGPVASDPWPFHVRLEAHPDPGALGDPRLERLVRTAYGPGVRLCHPFPGFVRRLSVVRLPPGAKAVWGRTDGFFAPGLTRRRLQEILDDKSRCVAGYEPCAEQWLVIDLADGPSRTVDLDRGLPEGPFPCAFDRAWILYRLDRRLLELPLERPQPPTSTV